MKRPNIAINSQPSMLSCVYRFEMEGACMDNNGYSIARINKDKHFDGKFIFAVSTTGIVCRPSCPSPIAKEENVTYYLTIYDAIAKGYRPCLRCQPDIYSECYTANLEGQKMLEDAMQMILDGYLDCHKISALASHFNLSERYFRKIFAKRLLINSNMPITRVALASGFGSIRQFNQVFGDVFKETPTEIRRNQRDAVGPGTTMLLPYNQPIDFKSILKFMKLRMIKGVEVVDEDSYSRTFNIRGIRGYFVITNQEEKSALALEVYCEDMSVYREIYTKVRRMFDLDTEFEKVKIVLSRDPLLKDLIGNKSIPRLPIAFDAYEFLIRAILGQQITVKAATTLAARIALRADIIIDTHMEGLSHTFPSLDDVITMSLEELGITKTRIATIKAVNVALTNEVVSLSINQTHEKFYETFTSVKGIGDWTANYVAMRGLGMVDAFPAGDLGVIKAMNKKKEYKIKDIMKLAEKWRPYRAYATLCLWQSLEDD